MELMYMQRALEQARQGEGYAKPGPLTGAVIVKNGRIIGEGFRGKSDEPHAEIKAINSALEDVRGALMYVNLEPCSGFKGTEPCVNKIIEHGIKKVVIGMLDPDPEVNGKSVELLRMNDIEVETGVLEEECRRLNEIYTKYVTTGMPFCILKTAMTWDGKIAPTPGDSRLITSELSRNFLHRLRHKVSAVMAGVGTIVAEDPLLTARLEEMEGIDPVRIIMDSTARIPLDAKILHVRSTAKTVIGTTELADKNKLRALEDLGAEILITPLKEGRSDLCYLVKELGKKGIDSLLVEGGCTLSFNALDEGIIDKVISIITPRIIGGDNVKTPVGGDGRGSVRDSMLLKNIDVSRFEDDIMIEGYLHKEEEPKCLPERQ